jgi:predicted hydrocarbon binding protein
MNFSRKELIKTEATMNQMRNAIFHLVRLMNKNGIKDSKNKLRKMGQNIAKTYINYWKPIEIVNFMNLKNTITTIYQKILNSSPTIDIYESKNLIIIRDNSCALCKYHYDDIEIAGCEILLGLVSEFINLINKDSNESSSIFLDPNEVIESRAYGNKTCIQKYNYRIGEDA